MSSTTSTQPQEKRVEVQPEPKAADAVEAKKAAMVDAVKAKGSITLPKPAPAPVKVTGSPAAAQVVKNLTANAPTVEATQPSPLEKATAGKPLVKAAKARKEPSKVTAETAKKARQAGSTDELLALARKRLPQNEDTLLVTFTVRQANVVLDALQFFSKYAPDLGSEDLNQAHDAAVYTAYYAAYDELDAPDVRGTKNARKRRSTALISEGQWAEDPSLAVSEPAKAKATAPKKKAVKAA